MASHRARAVVVAAVLVIASLLVAVALSGADARPTVTAALSGADVSRTGGNTKPELHDPPHGPGYVAAAAKPDDEVVKPDCDGDGDGDGEQQPKDNSKDNPKDNSEDPKDPSHSQKPGADSPNPQPADPGTDSAEAELDQELCTTCEEPKKPEPPCNTCKPDPKPKPEMTCNKVHAVQEGETCYSVGQCAGLGEEDFRRFNPNICCDNLFVGQWVCLDATCAA